MSYGGYKPKKGEVVFNVRGAFGFSHSVAESQLQKFHEEQKELEAKGFEAIIRERKESQEEQEK